MTASVFPLSLRRAAVTSLALPALAMGACSAMQNGVTPQQQEVLDTLTPGQYFPRTQEEREAIETQPLFAQAAFWSKEYDLNPADLEASLKLSQALRKMGNPSQAAEISQKSRALYPRNMDLVAEYAASLIAMEEGKHAIAPLSSAARQDSNNSRLWSLLGAANDQIGDYNTAREHYDKALRLSPNDPSIMANVGLSYALAGDAQTAEVWLRRAAANPNASASVRQNLSIVLGLQGKYDEAENFARQDLAPDGAENNLAYLRSMKSGARSYEALSETPSAPVPTTQIQPARTVAPTYQAPTAPTPSYSVPHSQSNHAPRVYGSLTAGQQSAPSYAAPSYRVPSAPKTSQALAPAPTYRAPTPTSQTQTARSYAPTQTTPIKTPSAAPQKQSGDILTQIASNLNAKTDPRTQMSYREMEAAYRAQQQAAQAQAQQQAQLAAQRQAQAQGYIPATQQGYAPAPTYMPQVNVQTYSNQAYGTAQNTAQRRGAARTRY